MSGKKIFRQSWLEKRFPLLYKKEVLKGDAANKYIQENFATKRKQ